MRVLIVDDNNEYRRLLRRILEEQHDLMLVAEASDGEEGVRLARELKPDVILMDIDMPGTNGLQATRRIKAVLDGATVVLLSAWDSEAYRQGAADCGADNYLLKTMPISEFLSVLRRVRPSHQN
jgi:two-component system, NarL family, response regulator DesR